MKLGNWKEWNTSQASLSQLKGREMTNNIWARCLLEAGVQMSGCQDYQSKVKLKLSQGE